MSSPVISKMLIRIAADTAQLRSEMNEAKRAVGGSFDEIKGMASGLKAQLIGLFAGIGVAKLAQEFIQTADAMAGLEARLKNTVGAGQEFANAQKEIYRIAQQNNIGIQEATTLFTKMNEPVKRLGGTVRDTSGIVEAFSLSLRLGGANTAEAASATLQFAQAMGSGKLQGDEFRSMAEASPRFMQALAEGMGVPIEKLKEMGSEGKLTADVVGNALIKSLDKLKSESGSIPDTVSGAFQRMKNDIVLAVDELNKNSGLTLGIAQLVESVRADLLPAVKEELSGAFAAVGDWIDKNRDGLGQLWVGVKGVVGDAWELIKVVAQWLSYLSETLKLVELLGAFLLGVRVTVAGIKDGVTLIAAGFAQFGSLILQTVLSPLQLVLKASAMIAGVFDKDLADKINGVSNSIDQFATAGSRYASGVVADFAAGKSSVMALANELVGATTTTQQLATETANASAAAGDASAAYTKLKNKNTELTKEQQQALDAYKKLIQSINDKTGAMQAEMAQGAKLTDGQKTALKVMQDIQNGTLKLTDTQKKAVTATLEQLLATERLSDEQKRAKQVEDDLRKLREDDAVAAMKEADAIEKEVEAQVRANESMRLTKKQLVELEVARLNERIAIMQTVVEQDALIGQCTKETAAHEATLEALKKLKAAREEGVYLEAARDAADEWKKTSDSIASNLTDALMRGFESGKGFMENFRDTLKNMFNTLILRPIIQPIAQGLSGSVMSMLGMPAQAGTGGAGGSAGGLSNITGMASMVATLGQFGATGFMHAITGGGFATGMGASGSLIGGGNIAGGIGMGAGTLAGYGAGAAVGIYGGRAISNGYSAFGGSGNAAVNAGTIIGMVLGGPIGAAIGGAIGGVVNRAFGMRAREYGERGLMGSLSGGEATGQTYANWHQDGGWFRSDRNGTDYGALTEEMSGALRAGAGAVLQQTRAWADVLKLPAESLANITHDFRVVLTDDAAQNQQAIADLMNSYQADMVQQYADFLTPFQQAGETLAETMNRLSVIQTFSNSIDDLGGVFSRIAQSSFTARQSLIDMAGGLDKLTGQIGQFVSDYYTEAEQAGLSAQAIAQALKAVGIDASQLMSREDYRALVESRDVDTEQGRQQLALLLQLGPQFAQLADYLKENGLNVEAAIQDAPAADLLGQMVDPAQTTATAVTSMANSVETSNELLTGIGNKLAAIADTSSNAASAAQAAVSAAQAAVKAAQDAVNAASLISSAPSYSYNIGGR